MVQLHALKKVNFLLALLIKDFDDKVIKFHFGKYGQDMVDEAIQFIFNLDDVLGYTCNRIDYTKYMLDKDVAEYLNRAQDEFFKGATSYEKFLYNEIVKGYIKKEYLNDYRVMMILSGLDGRKKYLKEEDIMNNYLKSELDKICMAAYGYGYSE